MSVTDPSGHRVTVPLEPVPFRIGRQPGNHLVLRDTRASRMHARIVLEDGAYWIEDLESRAGTYVNGEKIARRQLGPDDRINLGVDDSYQLVFTDGTGGVARALDAMPDSVGTPQLSRLKAVLEVARSLQSAASSDEILTSVVDAALAVTGAERGFLLLRTPGGLDLRVARDRRGALPEDDLRVPRKVLQRALDSRRDLLSMNFHSNDSMAGQTIADLDLRSIVCVPIVRMRSGKPQETSMLSAAADTAGVLYLDSRAGQADLSSGNRELLQTLAIEASTIIENARLLDEERERQRLDGELQLARQIQERLFPRQMPTEGWFRAMGMSLPCDQVGGDYFDLIPTGDNKWAVVVADVSGKGIASSLLASFLQGALLAGGTELERTLDRVNSFLAGRGESQKYATLFYGLLSSDGTLEYVNAGHPPGIILTAKGELIRLDATSPPVGLIAGMQFPAERRKLGPGDRLVLYSDGVLEASNGSHDMFGVERIMDSVRGNANGSCEVIANGVLAAVRDFTGDAPADDDITLLVAEHAPR